MRIMPATPLRELSESGRHRTEPLGDTSGGDSSNGSRRLELFRCGAGVRTLISQGQQRVAGLRIGRKCRLYPFAMLTK